MSDKDLVLLWLEHDFAYPGYQKACDAFERILSGNADMRDALETSITVLTKLSEESDCNIDPFTFGRWGGDAAIGKIRKVLWIKESPCNP